MKLFYLIFISFIFFSCQCTYSNPKPKVTWVAPQIEDGSSERVKNKKYSDYVSLRTVEILRDCSPRYNVIFVEKETDPNTFGDMRGTGVIIRSKDDYSYVATAAHVMEIDDPKLRPKFVCDIFIRYISPESNKKVIIKAEPVAVNSPADLGILKVEGNLNINTDFELNPFVGENVWAAGYPAELIEKTHVSISITKGTIATLGIKSDRGSILRTTAEVYFGSSGGGLWTSEGRLIGIISSIATGGEKEKIPYAGYYYVKPAEDILNLIKRMYLQQDIF
jgi:S1-C subfamily serine protease